MAWTDPASHTYSVDEIVSPATMNTYVKDNLSWLGGAKPMGRVTKASQLITTGGSGTAVLFDTEQFDTANNHSTVTNTSRFTSPMAGKYLLVGSLFASVSAISTSIALYINGSQAWVMGGTQTAEVTDFFALALNDYVEVFIVHSYGSSVNFSAALAWCWHGS